MLQQHNTESHLKTLDNGAISYNIHDQNRWIGFDLDGSLARFDAWQGVDVIGDPLEAAVEKVKELLAEGYDVRIFTARVNDILAFIRVHAPTLYRSTDAEGAKLLEKIEVDTLARTVIEGWCMAVFGQTLPITNTKDVYCVRLYDDIAVQMVPNTGESLAVPEQAEYLADKGRRPISGE